MFIYTTVERHKGNAGKRRASGPYVVNYHSPEGRIAKNLQHSISTKVVAICRILHIKDNIVCCDWVGWNRSILLGFQTITVPQNCLVRESFYQRMG